MKFLFLIFAAIPAFAHDHEAGPAKVGPGFGITEADHEKGFKLSPEAEKNFAIEKTAAGPVPPKAALLTTGHDVCVYRLREGFYKRVELENFKKEIAPGDFVVTRGQGFLRTAEVSAFGAGHDEDEHHHGEK